MSNVFPMVAKIEVQADPASRLKTAVSAIVALDMRLARAVKELSNNLDAFERVIELLEGTKAKEQLIHLLEKTIEPLTQAVCELSQQRDKLLALRNRLLKPLDLSEREGFHYSENL